MPRKHTNPFRYGKLVQNKDFCARPELPILREYLRSGQNIVLYGERRIGKTSLVTEAVRGMRGFKPLLIDIYEVQSVHSLSQRIASALVKALDQKLLQKFLRTISALRPTLTLNTEGMPVVGIDAQAVTMPSGLEPLLDYLCTSFSAPNTVIIFDEFQSLLNLPDSREVQAILRSKVQQQRGPFVFLGSIQHEMRLMFTAQDSPFRDSALPMEIGYLPRDKFQPYLANKFADTGYKVDEAVWDDIFSITGGQPNETQKLCSALWMAQLDTHEVTPDNLSDGFELIFAMQRPQFERDWGMLTDYQQRVLRTIAHRGGEHVTSAGFLEASGVTHAPTVRRAIDRLHALEIVIDRGGQQVFSDPFFRLWLMEKGY